MEAPEKLYLSQTEDGTHYYTPAIPFEREHVEYTRTDAFIEKAVCFLNDKLSDRVEIGLGTSIVGKQEFIDDYEMVKQVA